MKKRLLALLLALAMVVGYMPAMPAMADEDGVVDAVKPALTIYYTNDVHTYIKDATQEGKMSYATVAQLKKDKIEAGEEVLLVDAGDHIQGTAYGGMDNGVHMIQFMNAAGYDIATLGNHEFDYGMQGALDSIAAAEYPYVSANFVQDVDQDEVWEPVLNAYEIFEKGGKKYAFVGITTPETFTKSTPAYFQNENGEYIYDIYAGNDGQTLYDSVQKAIDDAKAEGADMVIALGHLGVDPSSSPWTSEEVIANVSGLDAFIDGHSHSEVPCELVKDKDGKEVVLSQTGCYLANVGQMTIAEDGTITAELIQSDACDADMNAQEMEWVNEVEEQLGTVIAETDINFTINGADGTRAVRKAETNLSDLDADGYYYYINEVANLDCDVAFTNGGGVRANIDAGKWTYNSAKTVNPFGNVLCLMEVPGQMILDALEFGARFGKNQENGGFLHPAGLIYKIDDEVANTVVTDDKNVWQEGPEEYRVYDVKVYNKETGVYEDLDVEKTYTVGGTNYTLRQQGDGFNMFQEKAGMKLVMEGICEDYMALSAYVAAFADTDGNGLGNIATANSPLAKYPGYLLNYEDPAGSGRVAYAKAELTIFFTNDVHTYIKDMTVVNDEGELTNADDMSYATVAQLKKKLEAAGEEVLLVDAGDHIQGTAYGGMDNGAHMIQFMNAAGYDLATLGNHEFDYGMQGALDSIAAAEYPYVSANFMQDTDQDGTWDPVLNAYEIFEKNGKKYAFVGITTPETFTKSTPAYFQNEAGEYIYDILGGTDGQALYESVQAAIDAAEAEGADYVIALGHLGIDASSHPWTSEDVIANVSGLDAFIDGHSHNEVTSIVTDKDGKDVVLAQTGCYLANVGQMVFTDNDKIHADLIQSTEYDPEVNEMEKAWIAEIKEQLGTRIAESDINFTIMNEDGSRAVRKSSTNMADLDADGYYYYINEVANLDCDVAFTNGGGVRADIAAGVWTYNSAKTVNPFGNVLCLMEVPGQMILDALEFGARFGKTQENGGFLHPAGLTYKIDDSVPNTVVVDEKNVWQSGPEVYRVYDVKIYNKETGVYEDLDVKKTYTVGGTNYTLRQQGDGFNMFQESAGMNLIMEGICEDYMALSTYVAAFADTDENGLGNISTANSPLAAYDGYLLNYESATGSGRIVYEDNALGVPAEVTAIAKTPTSVKVTWDAVKGADSYTVWYAKMGTAQGNPSWKYIVTKKTSVTIKNLKAGTTYDIFVSPKAGDKETYSDKVQVKTLKALAAPNAKAVLTSYKKVKVSWGKVADAASYKVLYKKASALKWSSKKTTKTALTLTLTPGTKYQIKVVAVASAGKYESKASAVKTVTTLKKLAAPKVVKSKNKVKVSFKNIAGETGYQISVSAKKTGTAIKATVKSTKATSKVLSVKKGKKLYYKVRAYKTVNGKKVAGPWSNTKAFTLK